MKCASWVPELLGVVLLGLYAMSGRADSLTFQQGLNGYSGCRDTLVGNGGSGEDRVLNFGINRFLIVNANGCDS